MGILYTLNNMINDSKSAVLSDRTIMKYNKKGLLIEQPIKDIQLQPNSVDLTLGNTYKTIMPNNVITDTYISGKLDFVRDARDIIDTINNITYESNTFDESILIGPREFMLLASNEILNIPNGILSFVQGRSSVARIGIQTEQAGLIDSGFRGTITFEVYNETQYPIKLYSGMRIAQVYFFKSQYSNKLYGITNRSKYLNQMEATGSKINKDPELSKYRK